MADSPLRRVQYRTHDVTVRGGQLRVGSWRTDEPVRRVVLAVHGITATHLAWSMVAGRLAGGTLLLAPDLRGRGRSSSLPGPWGMRSHAEDCRRVLDALADGRCDTAAGHSMGGFVVVMLAACFPDAVGELLLVDGGVPLALPEGVPPDVSLATTLGPAAKRLSLDFAARSDYQVYWQAHPAFQGHWTSAVAQYVDYDLDPTGPPYRSSCSADAMSADLVQQFVGGPVDAAWDDVRAPARFVRAPRGLLDEPDGLYPVDRLAAFAATHSDVEMQQIDDVNHYTVTLSERGATAIADLLSGDDHMVSKAG